MTKDKKQNQGSESQVMSIEELQAKYQDLHRKKIEAETRLTVTKNEIEKLRGQASATWGTDDLAELTKMLVKMKEDNEKRRADYQSSLELIETKLSEIEKQYRETSENAE